MVSAPRPRSVGVKLPWPKSGNTARPTMRSCCRWPLTVTVTIWPTVRPIRRSTEVPSTISWPVRGGWPLSRVGDTSGPRPGATPMAGTIWPLIPTTPRSPKLQLDRRAALPTSCWACCGVIVWNCKSIAASQLCPYRRGECTRCSRFAPKVNAAATASTGSAVPARALRTGMALRPRPGSSARRTPVTAVTGAPAPASHRAASDRRVAAGPVRPRGRAEARRQAGQAARASIKIVISAAPAASTVVSALTPGDGSASRAAPIGISGDAATARRPRPPPRPSRPRRPPQARRQQLAPGHPKRHQGRVARGRGKSSREAT